MKFILFVLFIIFFIFITYNTESFANSENIIKIDEEYTEKRPSNFQYPNEGNIVKYDESGNNIDSIFEEVKEIQKSLDSLEEQVNPQYRCNSENVDYKCNKSIDDRFLFGCQNMNPFPIQGKNIADSFKDPSEYYKKLNPVRAVMDKFNNYVGSNMPDYSNVAKIGEIGKIPLDINKVVPVQKNYVFKNSAALEFI